MGYKKPFIPLKVTATCNILNYTLIYSVSLLASIVVYHHLCSQNMLMNRSPPKTAISAKCILVTGSLWECLSIVGPESQGGQIPQFAGLMQWPSGAPGSSWECRQQAWERRRQPWEHLGVPATRLGAPTKSLGAQTKSLGVPTTNLGARRITVEQSGNNIIFFGNAVGVPENHSYYLLFNDF